MTNKRKSSGEVAARLIFSEERTLTLGVENFKNLSKSELLFRAQRYEEDYALEELIDTSEIGMALYPRERGFPEYLAKASLQTKEWERAITICQDRLVTDPQHQALRVLMVRAACKLERLSEAQQWIDTWSQQLPQGDWGSLYLAQAYLSRHIADPEGVFFYTERAIRFMPDSSEAFGLYAKAVEYHRRYDQAIPFYMDCIDQDPYSHLAWFYLAEAQLGAGQYYDAIQSYEYAYIAKPSFLKAYESSAELCAEMGYWRRSLITCLDLATRTDLNADHYAMMAKCYLCLNMSSEAAKYLKKLAACDPRHEELYFLIGDRYYAETKWKKAIMAYNIALQGNDQEDECIFRLARSLSKVGNLNQAILHFEKAVDLGPEQDLYWFVYAKYLLKEGYNQQAAEVLERAEEATFSPRLDFLRSILLIKNNQRTAGLHILSDALREDSGHLPLIYKFLPEAKNDRQIQSMIQYFRTNYE